MRILFLCVFFSINSLSLVEYQFRDYNKNQDHYIVAYQELHRWIIDEYVIKTNSLQERVSQTVFKSYLEWEQAVSKYSRKHKPIINNTNLIESELLGRSIWKEKDTWSLEWESKYRAWVKKEVDKHFFKKFNIATDCADVLFVLRWIFSRINHLAIGNTLAGSGTLFTNRSFKRSWRGLRRNKTWYKDKVFLASLNYLMNNTWTGSLYKDSFPVKISRETFGEGNFFLTMRGAGNMGHTTIIYDIEESPSSIKTMYSDVPRAVRTLVATTTAPRFVDPYSYSMRSMKWIKKKKRKWEIVASKDHPHYSEEQFQDSFMNGFDDFYNAFLNHLGLTLDYPSHYLSQRKNLTKMIKDRVIYVREGFEFCRENNCDVGTQNYDNYSSPFRDSKILEKSQVVKENFERLDQSLQESDYYNLERYLNNTSFNVETDTSYQFNLSKFLTLLESEKVSHDPRDTIEMRWGL